MLHTRRQISLAMLSLFAPTLALLTGCSANTAKPDDTAAPAQPSIGSTSHKETLDRTRSWDCEYAETVTIQTDPAGCRVYVQDKLAGQSPTIYEASGLRFQLVQHGTYARSWSESRWSGETYNVRTSETTWSPDLQIDVQCTSFYAIKVLKDGYQPEEKRIDVRFGDLPFTQAVGTPHPDASGNMPTRFHGQRTVNISLKPFPSTLSPQKKTESKSLGLPIQPLSR